MKAPWLRYELAKEGLWTKKAETERESVGKEGDEVDVQGEWKKVLGEEEEKGKGKREYWVQGEFKIPFLAEIVGEWE